MIRIMKKILELVPELRRPFYLSALFKILESVFLGAPYGFMVLILNDLLSGTLNMGRVAGYTVAMAGCFMVQGFFSYLFARAAYPIGTDLCEKIRIIVAEHLRKLPMAYFSQKSAGDLNAVVSDELMMISLIPRMAFPQLIAAVTLPFVFAPFLFCIDWRLALVTLTVIPVSIPLFLRCQQILRQGMQQRSQSLIDISSKIIEYVQGMPVIKAFGRTGPGFSTFEAALQKFKHDNLNLVVRSVLPLVLFKAILDLGFVLLLAAGAYLFLGSGITLPVLLIFLVLGLRLYEPVKAISSAYEIIRTTEVTMQRLQALLNTEPLPEPATGIEPGTMDIEFRNVTFSYGRIPVLNNISFTIPEKSITAFVGPSGAGKTTITRLIARFWDVDSGQIRIGGHNIKEMTSGHLFSLVSMVFQDVYLFNDTIFTNIAYGSKHATREQVEAAARAACCHDFITSLPKGYDTMVGEGGSTLSGGEKQRISIARAIVKDAPVILLDEATASVDPGNEHLIQEAINALVKSKTLIIIAHRLSTITAADQIIVLNGQGRIEDMGKHEELVNRSGLYQKFWQSRQQARGWKVSRPKMS